MKLLLLFFVLIATFKAKGADNFTYSPTSEFEEPSLVDIVEVETALESKGYWPLDLSNEQKLAGIAIDQAFFDPYSNKVVLLKFGLKVSDWKLNGKLLAMNGGDYVYHSTVANNRPYALYFIGHSQREAQLAVATLGFKEASSAMTLFLPSAKASCADSAVNALSILNPVASRLINALGPQRIFNCGTAAFQGARTSVNGMVNGTTKLFTHPSEFWSQTKQEFGHLWNFVKLIDSEVSKLASSLGGLDSDTRVQIGCTIAGELLPGILVGGLVGAGVVKASAKLALVISKLRLLSPALLAISAEHKAKRLQSAEKAIKVLVSCAI